MSNDVPQIHRTKQPRRPHHIVDWAERRGLNQTEIAEQLGADKSVVSRWFAGTSPSVDYQERLAALFHIEPEALFRHPDDDWIAKFLKGRSADEVERIKSTLETAFPRKAG